MMNSYFNDANESKYDLSFFICKHCSLNQSFDNSTEFRDHCLNYHDVDIRFAKSRHRLQDENYKRHVREHVYNYSWQSSHEYVTVKISIFEYDFTSCLNIDEKMNFCFKWLLFQNKNLYDIMHRIRLITITKIAEQQVCDKYIEQKMLLELNKFFVTIKIYLINRLQSDFIIDMNFLNRDDIDLRFNRNTFVIKKVNVSLCYSSIRNHTFYYFNTHYITNCIEIKINKKWKYNTKKSIDFASKVFCIFESCVRIESIEEIDQSEVRDYKQCENVKFEKYFTMYDDLIKSESVLNFVVRFAINFVDYIVFHICRRCKQFFDSDNLLHRHFTHCNRNIKCRDFARDFVAFWRKL